MHYPIRIIQPDKMPISFSAAPLKLCCAVFLLLACGLLHAQPAQTGSTGGSIHGIVKSGNMPLPGATITVVNLSTGQKFETSSNVAGSFEVAVLANGRYSVSAHMAAFAPLTRELQIDAENGNVQIVLELIREVSKA